MKFTGLLRIWLAKVTLCWFLYSVRPLYQIASTPYHEYERCNTNSVPWMYAIGLNESGFTVTTNCVHSWYGVGVTAFIYGTELVWPRSFMVRSWCDREHSWYGVGVIPQSHSTWFMCTLYSENSIGGFFPFCLSSMTSAAINLLCVSVTIRINKGLSFTTLFSTNKKK
jgi:hypothetical protein